jgi:UDP-glucose 4-epimerase
MVREVFEGKKILITGGLGFIGSNLAIHLVEVGAQVHIFDSLHPEYGGNWFNIEPVRDRVVVAVGDMKDEDLISNFVHDKDYIFNLAGQVSHISSMENPYQDLENNCLCHLSLLEACRKYNRTAKVLYAGTRGQYGRIKERPVREDHPLEPVDLNGVNKTAGEMSHFVYHRVYGIPVCSLRLTNTYGPRHQMKNSRQGIVNWFIRLALEDKDIACFREGSQLRDCNYVEDVVRAFLAAAAADISTGKIYNLGSGSAISVRGIIEKVIALAGSGKMVEAPFPEDLSRIEIGDYEAEFSRIKDEMGWTPRIDLDQGLTKTIEYYRKNKEHYF